MDKVGQPWWTFIVPFLIWSFAMGQLVGWWLLVPLIRWVDGQ